ncbi:MAG: CcmD family protein, partial [Solirubrobacteraceae bacterium]
GAFVPINFVIVRLSTAYLHPRVLGDISANLPGRFQVVFYLSLISIALLWITLWRYEMTSKHASAQLRALRRLLAGDEDEALPRRSAVPTLSVSVESGGGGNPGYVTAAYTAFFALILIYLAIMAGKLSRIERELGELTELAARRRASGEEPDAP